jgi:hypothetical protein
MANIQNDPHRRSTGPMKPKTEPLKTKSKTKQTSSEPKPKSKKDEMALGKSAERATSYQPGKAKAKEEEKGILGKFNDEVLDPLGKGDTVKGALIRHLAEPLEAAGNKIGKALVAIDQVPFMRGVGKALPLIGLIPTGFDIKAAIDAHKDPKASSAEKSLATGKAVLSSISSVLGVAAAVTTPAPPVAATLAILSLTFGAAAWATDLAKPKK